MNEINPRARRRGAARATTPLAAAAALAMLIGATSCAKDPTAVLVTLSFDPSMLDVPYVTITATLAQTGASVSLGGFRSTNRDAPDGAGPNPYVPGQVIALSIPDSWSGLVQIDVKVLDRFTGEQTGGGSGSAVVVPNQKTTVTITLVPIACGAGAPAGAPVSCDDGGAVDGPVDGGVPDVATETDGAPTPDDGGADADAI